MHALQTNAILECARRIGQGSDEVRGPTAGQDQNACVTSCHTYAVGYDEEVRGRSVIADQLSRTCRGNVRFLPAVASSRRIRICE